MRRMLWLVHQEGSSVNPYSKAEAARCHPMRSESSQSVDINGAKNHKCCRFEMRRSFPTIRCRRVAEFGTPVPRKTVNS